MQGAQHEIPKATSSRDAAPLPLELPHSPNFPNLPTGAFISAASTRGGWTQAGQP